MKIEDLPPLPDRRLFEYGETIAGYEARLAYAKELLLHSPTDAKWLDVEQFRKFFELRAAFIEKLNQEGL